MSNKQLQRLESEMVKKRYSACVRIKQMLSYAMRMQGVSKSELARRMNVFPQQVTRILDPGRNTSVNVLEAALKAVGYQLMLSVGNKRGRRNTQGVDNRAGSK